MIFPRSQSVSVNKNENWGILIPSSLLESSYFLSSYSICLTVVSVIQTKLFQFYSGSPSLQSLQSGLIVLSWLVRHRALLAWHGGLWTPTGPMSFDYGASDKSWVLISVLWLSLTLWELRAFSPLWVESVSPEMPDFCLMKYNSTVFKCAQRWPSSVLTEVLTYLYEKRVRPIVNHSEKSTREDQCLLCC